MKHIWVCKNEATEAFLLIFRAFYVFSYILFTPMFMRNPCRPTDNVKTGNPAKFQNVKPKGSKLKDKWKTWKEEIYIKGEAIKAQSTDLGGLLKSTRRLHGQYGLKKRCEPAWCRHLKKAHCPLPPKEWTEAYLFQRQWRVYSNFENVRNNCQQLVACAEVLKYFYCDWGITQQLKMH